MKLFWKENKYIFIILFALSGFYLIKSTYFPIYSVPTHEEETIQKQLSNSDNSEKVLDKNDQTENPQKFSSQVTVYISGAVATPQVITLSQKARLVDAIERCGGLLENADASAINLALVLEEEGHYHIPTKEETQSNGYSSEANYQMLNGSSDKLVNINQANKEELMSLPTIGEKKAELIIAYREQSTFQHIEEIKQIAGIGEKSFEQLKDLISIH